MDGRSGVRTKWNWELSLNTWRFWYLLVSSNIVITIGPFDVILLMQTKISLPIYLYLYVYEWSFYVSNDVYLGCILLYKWVGQILLGLKMH